MIGLFHKNLDKLHNAISEKAEIEANYFQKAFQNKSQGQLRLPTDESRLASLGWGAYLEIANRVQAAGFLLVILTTFVLSAPLLTAAIIVLPSLVMKDNRVNAFVIEVYKLIVHEAKVTVEMIAVIVFPYLMVSKNTLLVEESNEIQETEKVELIETPLEACERKAREGDADACFEMYERYLAGNEVEKDLDMAEVFFNQAYHRLHPDALYLRGLDCFACAEANRKIPRGTQSIAKSNEFYVKAKENFSLSANQKEGPANYYLALCYHYGYGTEKNFELARDNFEIAVRNNIIAALPYLATYKLKEARGPQQQEEGMRLLQKAIDSQNINSIYMAGSIILNGSHGVTKNRDIGKKYLAQAAALGHEQAKIELENANKRFLFF